VREKTVPAVFSSKFIEWVLACITIVADHVSGSIAVIRSPVWALLNPLVSLIGCAVSTRLTFKSYRYHKNTTVVKVATK
jgi:hypothetical protein